MYKLPINAYRQNIEIRRLLKKAKWKPKTLTSGERLAIKFRNESLGYIKQRNNQIDKNSILHTRLLRLKANVKTSLSMIQSGVLTGDNLLDSIITHVLDQEKDTTFVIRDMFKKV